MEQSLHWVLQHRGDKTPPLTAHVLRTCELPWLLDDEQHKERSPLEPKKKTMKENGKSPCVVSNITAVGCDAMNEALSPAEAWWPGVQVGEGMVALWMAEDSSALAWWPGGGVAVWLAGTLGVCLLQRRAWSGRDSGMVGEGGGGWWGNWGEGRRKSAALSPPFATRLRADRNSRR